MPIRADYHLHSHFSGDSKAPMEDMILRAIELGYTEMCFTEHMDLDFPVREDVPAGMFEVNTDSYLFDLIKYREKYEDKIKVNFGIELGMQPHISRENARYVKSHDFDFVIASTHIVNHKDPGYPDYYDGITEEEGYRAYFEEILTSIRSFTNFDVYGHLDYVIRYSRSKDQDYSYFKYADIFEKIIDVLLYNGKGIEINTGGLDKGLKEQHPCTDFLKAYRQKGGEIVTVGSDAHRPQDMGRHFARAAEVLKECGFTHYCTFEKRVPTYHKI